MGTYTEILEMEKKYGLELLVEISGILSIIMQEEELERKHER